MEWTDLAVSLAGLAFWLFLAFLTGSLAARTGHSAGLWFLFGLVAPALALALLAALAATETRAELQRRNRRTKRAHRRPGAAPPPPPPSVPDHPGEDASPERDWYVGLPGGAPIGPLDRASACARARDQDLLVWHPSLGEWKPWRSSPLCSE